GSRRERRSRVSGRIACPEGSSGYHRAFLERRDPQFRPASHADRAGRDSRPNHPDVVQAGKDRHLRDRVRPALRLRTLQYEGIAGRGRTRGISGLAQGARRTFRNAIRASADRASARRTAGRTDARYGPASRWSEDREPERRAGCETRRGPGSAVPDWPTTFGYNMFRFPISKWVGGIFFEHTHRLIASIVGFLTIVLAIWIWRVDHRRWLRNLGFAALGAVILQGVLGGLRVTLLKDEIGIFHALLAQAFLGMVIVITLATSRLWQRLSRNSSLPARVRALSRVVMCTSI